MTIAYLIDTRSLRSALLRLAVPKFAANFENLTLSLHKVLLSHVHICRSLLASNAVRLLQSSVGI